MEFTAEEIQKNWDQFNSNIEKYISGERKQKLLDFYKKYEDRVVLMPAAHKKEYHNAFPGGYVDHINRVVSAALKMYDVWAEFGADMDTFTTEELIFSAINHDLGKIGSAEYESYIPQTDKWRKDKLGEDYMFNKNLEFASVPDRGLFMLQSHGIIYTFNEMLAIQTHDGLYDDANTKYLKAFMPEQKPRTSLPYILHQADLMAARIEFEKEWLPKFNSTTPEVKSKSTPKNFHLATRDKALKSTGSNKLQDIINNI